MELRSSNHLHFIKTVKGGLVTQVLNISRGRPELVFKCVEDLYENTEMLSSCPVLKAKDGVDRLSVDSDDVIVQNHCVPVVHRRIIKITKNSGINCSSGDEKGDSDLEDTGCGNITLKQIKERCRGKKRKCTTICKLNEETAETCSELEQVYSNIQEEEDEHDLTTPLSCFKSKISKKKGKRKSIRNYSSTLLEDVKSIVKSGEQYKGGAPVLTDIKVTVFTSEYSYGQEAICVGDNSSIDCNVSDEVEAEIPELDRIEAQSIIFVAGNSSESCNENVDSVVVEIPKFEDSSLNCDEKAVCSAVEFSDSDCSDAQVLSYSSESRNENTSCSLFEISESDCSDAQVVFHIPGDSSFYSDQNADSCGVDVIEPNYSDGNNIICVASKSLSISKETGCDGAISSTVLEAANECFLVAEPSLPFSKEPQSLLVDECHVYMEPADSKLLPPERAMVVDTMWTQIADSKNHRCPELLVPECKNEGGDTLQIPNNLSSDTISQIDCCSEVSDISQDYPSMTNMSRPTNSEQKIEVPDIAVGTGLRHRELHDMGAQCTFDKGNKDDLITNYEANAISIPIRFTSNSSASIGNDLSTTEEKQPTCVHGCLASVDNNLHAAKEKQPLLFTVSESSRESLQFNPSVVNDDPKGLLGDRNCECTQLQHEPKRLFSARKSVSCVHLQSISPTSRKSLCKALESDGCCIKEPHECDGELCSVKQTTNEISTVGDPNQTKRTENETSTSENTKKPNYGKKGSPPKRKLKVSLLSRGIPSLSSGCSSIQMCSENAIAFSEQQMRDIERIATRLTEELRTMKDIVQEKLYSQTSPTKSPKYDVDEVRIAISNAEKAEETTQRWLTMMTKDCKRFCKIMSLTEKNSVASTNAVQLPCLTEKGCVGSGNADNKKRKKITFADEAGGNLCHVKIFEDEDGFSGRNQKCYSL